MSLPIVDATTLPEEYRALIRPDEMTSAQDGHEHRRPRFFYAVESWAWAKAEKLTAHFTLAELMSVDCREAPVLLGSFPHYVPCAISVLARYLQEFRARVEAPVMISVNGGYRSPAHALSTSGSVHAWGTAANLYRIGDTWLNDEKSIDRYTKVLQGIGPELRVKPYGTGLGETNDHLHVDLGFLRLNPFGWNEG